MAEKALSVASSAAGGKIPFRSKKIRKSCASEAEPSKKPRLQLIPLSAAGEIDSALQHLSAVDSDLSGYIESLSPPSFSTLSTPFLSLSRTILYQQLAPKAASAIYDRFLSLCGSDESSVVPEAVLALSTPQLRQIGVSSRKASYLHDLATRFRSGFLSDSEIPAMGDEELFSKLIAVKGIGPWSIHMFMIFSLHRPDVLPTGDLGVRKGVQILRGLKKVPLPEDMEELCQAWRPFRSVGAWYMWKLLESKGKPAKAK